MATRSTTSLCSCGSKVFFDELGWPCNEHCCEFSKSDREWAGSRPRQKDGAGGVQVGLSPGVTATRPPDAPGQGWNIDPVVATEEKRRAKSRRRNPIEAVPPGAEWSLEITGVVTELLPRVDVYHSLKLSRTAINRAFLGVLGDGMWGQVTIHVLEDVTYSYTAWVPRRVAFGRRDTRFGGVRNARSSGPRRQGSGVGVCAVSVGVGAVRGMLVDLRSPCQPSSAWIVLPLSFMTRHGIVLGTVSQVARAPSAAGSVGRWECARQVSGRNRWVKTQGCAGSKAYVVCRRRSHGVVRHRRIDRIVATSTTPSSKSPDQTSTSINGVPQLVVARRLRRAPEAHDPQREYQFRYMDKHHSELPHVVKFSGGRSSGMLLLTLLANGILKPERGDVVVFNNTSSEHPNTYEFVRECKAATEERGIPFFMVEFQTFEDARKGEWTRLPSYRLVNDEQWSDDNLDGFHWKGEVFEEVMSWSGFRTEPVPGASARRI